MRAFCQTTYYYYLYTSITAIINGNVFGVSCKIIAVFLDGPAVVSLLQVFDGHLRGNVIATATGRKIPEEEREEIETSCDCAIL